MRDPVRGGEGGSASDGVRESAEKILRLSPLPGGQRGVRLQGGGGGGASARGDLQPPVPPAGPLCGQSGGGPVPAQAQEALQKDTREEEEEEKEKEENEKEEARDSCYV